MRAPALDLGSDPVALTFAFRSIECPNRFAQALRHRSGWLRVVEARRRFSFGLRKRDLLVCLDDCGNHVPPYTAKHLFDMRTGLPQCPYDAECDEDFERIEDELVLAFLRETDREVTNRLWQADRESELQIARSEAVFQQGVKELTEHERALRTQRHDPSASSWERLQGRARIERLEALHEGLIGAFGRELAAMRQVHADHAVALMADFDAPWQTETTLTLQWRVMG